MVFLIQKVASIHVIFSWWDTLYLKKNKTYLERYQRCACPPERLKATCLLVRGRNWSKKKNHKLILARQFRLQLASSSPTQLLSLDAKALGDSFGLSGKLSPSTFVEADSSIYVRKSYKDASMLGVLFRMGANRLIAGSPECGKLEALTSNWGRELKGCAILHWWIEQKLGVLFWQGWGFYFCMRPIRTQKG